RTRRRGYRPRPGRSIQAVVRRGPIRHASRTARDDTRYRVRGRPAFGADGIAEERKRVRLRFLHELREPQVAGARGGFQGGAGILLAGTASPGPGDGLGGASFT